MPPDKAGDLWPHAKRFVYNAIDRVGWQDAREVEFDVLTGKALLWMALTDQSECIGAGVTRLTNGPDGKVCEIIAWGSDDHARCHPLLSVVENFAKAEGCDFVDLIGREGWKRRLPDYKPRAVFYRKELS